LVTDLMKQLLEAGVHFGHQTKRWNPKMAPFIFGQRNGIYIINLERTAERLEGACNFISEVVARGESVLFVGTKKQAKEAVLSEAQRCGMFSVTERWLGGLMTNFATVRSSVKRMKEIEAMKDDPNIDALTKKERSALEKEWAKLNKNLSGVADMRKLPGVIIIIDPKKEETAVREARKLGIPIVALIDTNSNPDTVDFPIPGNDDAIRAIKLVLTVLADSVTEGKRKQTPVKAAESDKGEVDR